MYVYVYMCVYIYIYIPSHLLNSTSSIEALACGHALVTITDKPPNERPDFASYGYDVLQLK